MSRDAILEEIRNTRRRIEAECGNDWGRLFAHYVEVQKAMEAEGRRIVPGRPRPLREAPLGS